LMMSAQVDEVTKELKPNGSDFNLFFSPGADLSMEPVFPGGVNLSTWRGVNDRSRFVTCERGTFSALTMRACPETKIPTSDNDAGSYSTWFYNTTDLRIRLASNRSFAINLDCEGKWGNCANGTSSTRICMDPAKPWSPTPPVPPEVDNQAWTFVRNDESSERVTIVSTASSKCLEVCREGGGVKGCDGKSGSTLRLAACDSDSFDQRFYYDGKTIRNEDQSLCVAAPPPSPLEMMDVHSIVADPRFVDAGRGNFSLRDDSPALKELDFQKIPPIEAPQSTCGVDAYDAFGGPRSCLNAFFRALENNVPFEFLAS